VAWTADNEFDEATYREDVANCCRAGVPGMYTGGTTGEFYAMELDEFRAVTRATIEESRAYGIPTMIGCSSTYTLGVIRRATIAAEMGADAIQLALPYWMEVGEREIVPFFEEVAAAADGMALSIYETTRAKRTLTLEQHRAIKEAVPTYLMVKANAGTLGATPEGCEALSELVNVFVGEHLWKDLGPRGARGCCSSVVYWNPRVVLDFWSKVEQGDWEAVGQIHRRSAALFEFLDKTFDAKGLTDSSYDRLGGLATGFLKTSLRHRGPYPSATVEDVETLRRWYQEHFPEMLDLSGEA
jgi:4-hydroxy-tetrahydrodipicolinate synthase